MAIPRSVIHQAGDLGTGSSRCTNNTHQPNPATVAALYEDMLRHIFSCTTWMDEVTGHPCYLAAYLRLVGLQ